MLRDSHAGGSHAGGSHAEGSSVVDSHAWKFTYAKAHVFVDLSTLRIYAFAYVYVSMYICMHGGRRKKVRDAKVERQRVLI